MALTKIKGQNFRVFVGGSAIPEAVSCSVQLHGSMEDSSTKDSEGSFAEEQMVSRSWSVQVDSYDATLATLRALITRFNSDSTVSVGWDQTATTAGSQNRTKSNAPFARSGQAHLSDLNIVANNRQTVNVSCTYTGSGAIS